MTNRYDLGFNIVCLFSDPRPIGIDSLLWNRVWLMWDLKDSRTGLKCKYPHEGMKHSPFVWAKCLQKCSRQGKRVGLVYENGSQILLLAFHQRDGTRAFSDHSITVIYWDWKSSEKSGVNHTPNSSPLLSKLNGGILTSNSWPSWRSILKITKSLDKMFLDVASKSEIIRFHHQKIWLEDAPGKSFGVILNFVLRDIRLFDTFNA